MGNSVYYHLRRNLPFRVRNVPRDLFAISVIFKNIKVHTAGNSGEAGDQQELPEHDRARDKITVHRPLHRTVGDVQHITGLSAAGEKGLSKGTVQAGIRISCKADPGSAGAAG